MPVPKENSVILLHGIFDDKVTTPILPAPKGGGLGRGDFFVLEGRPNLEAAVNNCNLLLKMKLKPTLIADNMTGFLFFKNCIKEVRIAYQYIDAKGALCDIGALILGALAKRHKVPIYLYPGKTRTRFLGNPNDLIQFQGKQIAPKGTRAYAPLVEWLPKKYITKIL